MKDSFGRAFCVLPWVHSFTNLGGEYQVCCTSEEFHQGIKNSQGKIFHIQDKPSLNEVMNSDFMKELRLNLLDGKMPSLCTRCISTENNGGVSRRNVENMKFQELIPELIDNTSKDGTIPLTIKSADYRLGNLCNLQCRMCNPRSTVKWIKDWNEVKLGKEKMVATDVAEYSNYNWIEDDYLIQEVLEKLPFLEHLHFAGGEPLIAPKMTEVLRKCVESGFAQNITLTYNTNITQLPKSVLALWKSFKTVRLYCSIDGFGKVNDYIRLPSKWAIIHKNLSYLDQEAENLNISQILLSTTVQAHNVLNLDDLYEYVLNFKVVVPALNLNNLYSPSYLATQLLPADIKRQASERLLERKEKLLKILPDYEHYLIDNIDDVLKFMNSHDHSGRFTKAFQDYNEKIDQMKGFSLQEYIPELYDNLLHSN